MKDLQAKRLRMQISWVELMAKPEQGRVYKGPAACDNPGVGLCVGALH
jgi:hypothetical protein